ncbi:MAG: hypothetical protein ACOYYS_05745 [Chloroflexota bacterium]
MQDELMIRFGGQQADSLMQRFQIDESMPLEFNVVGRLIESSQSRVEGANFDVRKHLLEYDDVLNKQRAAIYAMRDRIFVKDDLGEDVAEMLRTEINRRAAETIEDPEGPWKLLAWLDQVQPTRPVGSVSWPSYTIRLMLDQLKGKPAANRQQLQASLLELAGLALDREADHILETVKQQLEQTQDRIKEQQREREDALDMLLEGLGLDEEGSESPRNAKALNDAVSGALRAPVRLTPEQVRLLEENPRKAKNAFMPLLQATVTEQNVRRLLWAIARRMGGPLDLDIGELAGLSWNAIHERVLDTLEETLENNRQRLIGKDGAIQNDLETMLAKAPAAGGYSQSQLTELLMRMATGVRGAFDKRTHRRIQIFTTRVNYVYYAAHLLEQREAAELGADILQHLETTQAALQADWGENECKRLSTATPAELDERTQNSLRQRLGETAYQGIQNQTLGNLTGEQQKVVAAELGRRIFTEACRQILLGVITELWVDYLTQMEALRVSISLESYAQRDPLVQYKSQASELYQNLLRDTRIGVISRIFTARPRQAAAVQATAESVPEAAEGGAPELPQNGDGPEAGEEGFEPGIVVETAEAAEGQRTSGGRRRRRRR